MKIVVLATGGFAVPSLRWLAHSRDHEVVSFVTRPVRTRPGRRDPPPAPAPAAAQEFGWPIHTPTTVNDASTHGLLRREAPDLFFVCDYGEILTADTLRCARLGGINLHGSLLPDYRGAAPVQWAILEGRVETGVSVIQMSPRLDAGPVLSQRRLAIHPDESAEELEARLAELGPGAVAEAMELLQTWDGSSTIGTLQSRGVPAPKAPRLRKEDGQLDWNQDATVLHHRVRALWPWPGTFTTWRRPDGDAVVLKIVRAQACPHGSDEMGLGPTRPMEQDMAP
ncbi:MAG TPA: methionyl-tRNA formyltransferase, partial [Pirellulaceae bacterium]